MIRILVHAGAWNTPDERVRRVEMSAVKQSVFDSKNCTDVVSAVETAVVSLEKHPELDAGIGSILQLDGIARMDAGIADSMGRYGAVLQIEEISTPVAVARKLMETGYHHVLSGKGAFDFALEQGFKRVSVITQKCLREHLEIRREIPVLTYDTLIKGKEEYSKKKLSTVGAVAVDEHGNLCVASSTGGLCYGYPGRVADTALLGMGLYCTEHIAVACTGHGEAIMRLTLAQRVERHFLKSGDLQNAVDLAVVDLGRIGGEGGVIAAEKDGMIAVSYNTPFLATADLQF